jgi:predicted nucleotide-binding protein (sugar kinase/HSP70/actin superfamily)
MGTPEVVEAAFTRERDVFKQKNVEYFEPSLNLARKVEACDKLFEYFKDRLNITRDESAWAFHQGVKAMELYISRQQELFTTTMNKLIEENRIGLLLIGHPYHHDFGLNHKIPDEFCKRGYPVFTIESIPADDDFLENLFGKNKAHDISDVWFRSFNRNTIQKVWATKIAARHPNMGVIDLSSFKCGHDPPTYNYIDKICDVSETPHFTFHDIDQNRPGSTFKIRIETIDYFLKEYERSL